jgi:hypothetical protein
MKPKTIALLAISVACSLRDLSSLDSQYDASTTSDASPDVVIPSSCVGDAGLVARWPMTEGAGFTVHDCAGGHDGTMADAGVTWLADPEAGTVLGFDGGAVRPNVDFTIEPPITVSAWVHAANPQPAIVGVIMIQGDSVTLQLGWEFSVFGAKHQLDVGLANPGEKDFTSTVSLSGWSHAAATFDGVNVVLYVNGQPSLTDAIDAGYNYDGGTSPKIRIGQAFASQRSYVGTMRDVRIYSRVLSASEISALAQ